LNYGTDEKVSWEYLRQLVNSLGDLGSGSKGAKWCRGEYTNRGGVGENEREAFWGKGGTQKKKKEKTTPYKVEETQEKAWGSR